MTRRFWVFLHRWLGLTTAAFLVLVGLTGALLAFRTELERAFAPEFYPAAKGVFLSAAALARKAEAIAPGARALKVNYGRGGRVAFVTLAPDARLGFDTIYLDPADGREIARMMRGGLAGGPIAWMNFLYRFHYTLALGDFGFWVLGLTALAWTLDCFVALGLALPAPSFTARKSYADRLKRALQVRWRGPVWRFSFDWHRAGGLWFWPILLIFAWSSVYMNLNDVYSGAMGLVFEYRQPLVKAVGGSSPLGRTILSWEAAERIGEDLMAQQARDRHFEIGPKDALYLLPSKGLFQYRVRSTLDIGEGGGTVVIFDAYSGELRDLRMPSGRNAGETVTSWLYALHVARVFGFPFRVLVFALGFAIVALSTTGVVIWWNRRGVRRSGSGAGRV